MIKILKRISLASVIVTIVVFMNMQFFADLYLPILTSNIIDEGVVQGDIDHIWHTGFVMIGFSFISIFSSIVNAFFATLESQKLGKRLKIDMYKKSESLKKDIFDKYRAAFLITRKINDVTQIQIMIQIFLRIMIRAPITLVDASFLD